MEKHVNIFLNSCVYTCYPAESFRNEKKQSWEVEGFLQGLGPAVHLSMTAVYVVSSGLWELLCLHIHSLGQTLYWAPGLVEMRHKTTMSLPRGAGGMAVELLSVGVLFDLNVFIFLMPRLPLGRGGLGERRGTLTNLWQLEALIKRPWWK